MKKYYLNLMKITRKYDENILSKLMIVARKSDGKNI